jgi:TP901 family phage tail tape measure protein
MFGSDQSLNIVIKARDEASRVLKDVQSQLTDMEPIFRKMAIAGTAGFAATATAALKATSDFGQFDTQIQRAGANVGATSEQLAIFRTVAKDAARESGVSATAAAEALFYLAGGSVSAEEASAVLADTIKFAVANSISLTEATKQSAAAMTLFNIEAEDVNKVLDVLTRAGQVSFATMDELSAAFGEAAPIAAQVGVSIEDLTAIIGSFAEVGVIGSSAGVAIKRAFTELLSPSKQMTEGLAMVGLTAEQLQSQLNDPISMLETLEDALSGITDPIQKATALSQIFGQVSGPAMAALLGMGTEAIRDMQSDLLNASGAMEDASARIQAARSPMELLSTQMEILSVTIGESLMEPLKEVVGRISAVASAVGRWIEENPKLTANIIMATGAMAGIVAVLGTMGLAIITILPALQLIGAGILLLTSPIGLLVAAMAGAAVLIVMNWDTIMAALGNFRAGWEAMWDGVYSFFTTTWELIKSAGTGAVNFFIGLAEGMANAWVNAVNTIIKALNKIQVNVPDWVPGIGGNSFGINIPLAKAVSLPRLEFGGIIPGAPGTAVPMIGHAGERVVPRHMVEREQGGTNVVVTINNPQVRNSNDITEMRRQIEMAFRDVTRQNKIAV